MWQAPCQMPYVLTHLILMRILEHRCYSPHFRDEEGGVTERLSNFPSWHSKPQHQDQTPGSLVRTPLSFSCATAW